MSNNFHSFLDAWAASYQGKKNPLPETKILSVNITPEKLVQKTNGRRQLVAPTMNANPNRNVPGPVAVPFRSSEKLSTTEFLQAIKDAGKRQGKFDQNLVKTDQIEALRNFIGYQYGEPHGTQLDNARRQALTKVKGTGPSGAAMPQGAGFVAGMPDGRAKRRSDLQRRVELSLSHRANLAQEAKQATGFRRQELMALVMKEEALIEQFEKELESL